MLFRSSLLDEGIAATVEPAMVVSAPHLVGRTVEEIRALAARNDWGSSLGEIPPIGRVVAQFPSPGTPMVPGARIQVAVGSEGP